MSPNQHHNSSLSGNISNNFDIKRIIFNYLKHWKWFVFSIAVFLSISLIYLRYAIPTYNAYAKIVINVKGSSSPGQQVLQDMQYFSESDNQNVTDEIEVLKSRLVLGEVIRKLSLNVQFSLKGSVKETPLFQNSPININFNTSDSIVEKSQLEFNINVLSTTKFSYLEENTDEISQHEFGKSFETSIGNIIITPNKTEGSDLIGKTIIVRIIPLNKLAEYYKETILINRLNEFSEVIEISLNDPIFERAKSIINTLIYEYNLVSDEAKNLKSKNAADFIDERINLISKDLSNVDDQIEKFKTGSRLTDITSEAQLYINSSSQMEQELASIKNQLNLVNYMKNYVLDSTLSLEPIPSNIGLTDSSVNDITARYNDLLRQRNGLLEGSTKSKNPIVVNLDQQLQSLKSSLIQSLENSAKTYSFQINSLEKQSNAINSKIYQVPGQVRESRDIEREQGIKESLYLYLLQKREEATIALTSTSMNARIIDDAYSSNIPVSPKPKIVFMAAFIFGLLIPFSIIYIKDLLDSKIHNREDLENRIKDITVLGEIPRLTNKEVNTLVKRNDLSLLSESFRIIRTNFDYVKRGRHVKDYNNVIFVTSTINGEGKSFFSINLALTFANTDKRVLLIGADIRNPQIEFEPLKQKKKAVAKIGLTEYLSDDSILLGETINTVDVGNNNIDVLLSGKIPPNPAELLMSDRMKPLFDKVSEQYDYVIVDTAPAMLVTDTLLFSHFAGHTVYMTRADYTESTTLNFAKELHDTEKLKGMMFVVNDVNKANFGYGVKYGEYGARKKKSFFKKF